MAAIEEPPPTYAETVQEITRIYKSLPPRLSIEEVAAAISVLHTVETEVEFRSHEQRKEAALLVEVDRIFQVFDGLNRKASAMISGEEITEEVADLGGVDGEVGRKLVTISEGKSEEFDDREDIVRSGGDSKGFYPVISSSKALISSSGASRLVGRDVSECLQQAISRKGLDMRVAVLINDTVGTLALGHYYDEDTVIAVIFGTGTNACYLERADAIIKCQGLLTTSGGMVVNMEWGNFWSSHLPRTSYDIDLDADSPNPNDQGFEKMISGMYLGDIVRRVILHMSQESDVFGPVSPKLHVPFILRAARLAVAGIVGILKKIRRDGSGGIASGKTKSGNQNKMKRTVVAVGHGFYTNYTIFREYLNEAMGQILGDNVASDVIIKVTEDGSGIGAAILAASHSASVELP